MDSTKFQRLALGQTPTEAKTLGTREPTDADMDLFTKLIDPALAYAALRWGGDPHSFSFALDEFDPDSPEHELHKLRGTGHWRAFIHRKREGLADSGWATSAVGAIQQLMVLMAGGSVQ